jgi:hypothetical protein
MEKETRYGYFQPGFYGEDYREVPAVFITEYTDFCNESFAAYRVNGDIQIFSDYIREGQYIKKSNFRDILLEEADGTPHVFWRRGNDWFSYERSYKQAI